MIISPEKEQNIISVSDLSYLIKSTIEDSFFNVVVSGEVSSLTIPSSGHVYFTLKDSSSSIKATVWKGVYSSQSKIKEGDKVILTGKVTTYAPTSSYQLSVSRIELAGKGDLMAKFEELKKKLSNLGVFDESHKKPLPRFPKKIGIITSPTGAVIEDILHRLNDRYPNINVILYAANVQGEGAYKQIIKGIKKLNDKKLNLDLIIIARGGGSLEDLWTFNEEELVMKIFDSNTPIVSAIGHEPDFTLCDYVADLRAPTPTAAAELITPDINAILLNLSKTGSDLYNKVSNKIELLNAKLLNLKSTIKAPSKIMFYAQTIDILEHKLSSNLKQHLDIKTNKLSIIKSNLNSFNPQFQLNRGFVYVTNAKGVAVKSAKTDDKNITINFHDGKREAVFK